MKKIMIVLLNIAIVFAYLGLIFTTSYAGEGSISAPATVGPGENFTVTVSIPSDAVGYQGEITVKYADGTTQSSGNLTVVTGITGDYTHPGNMSHTFTATGAEGTATITVSNLKITDKGANRVNTQTTLTGSVNVAKPAAPANPQPASTPDSSSTTNSASGEPTWSATGDTAFATETVNIRSGWGTNNSSLGKLQKGSSVTRIAKGSNGWDKVSYNGQTGYIMSKYLSTKNTSSSTDNAVDSANTTVAEPTWNETGDKVYATVNMNVRSGWDKSFASIGGLQKGDSVTRVAVGSNGWDKIKYGKNTGYVLSKLLTTKVVEPDPKENTIDETNNTNSNLNTNTNTNSNTNVNTNTSINEGDEYNKIVEEVGVLPTVGKRYSDYIYLIAVIASITMIGYVGLKIRED